MSEQRTALVTGANKGIGYEVAAGLGRRGFSVGVGARDAARREEAVGKLRAEGLDVFGVPLDVTSGDSVRDAVELLAARGGLHVLVNNAGITGGPPALPSELEVDRLRSAVETNVLGVVRVTNAFLPQLRAAASPRIVCTSSRLGSFAYQAENPDPPVFWATYTPTKAFLNAVVVQYAQELRGTGILVNAACPGYTATDLNDFAGHRTPAQGAEVVVRLATLPDDGPTGGFFAEEGELPW
ncbi:SDR family NAD(P)-dependent oxidoreductase [Kineococcus rhizosphaerae]|uniref:Short-subunit dehydrogenase n=1 Tax=Kineococcus rhizosphaerae TaxID=559628 RepID=A0A2T0R696_9ACTN|nr:SDR family NAD(P)-dependent oxidoreductase [Kineococcus rhizosphaerae]PRY16686.1 short-subunit dehydrogenase [Kineococcus rhizosphaerae]